MTSQPHDRKMSTIEKIILLRSVEVFQGFSIEELSRMADITREIELPLDACLYHEGDPPEKVYVIAEGMISVQIQGVEVTQFGPRTALGGLSFFDDLPHQGTAIAVVPGRALVFDKQEVDNMISRYPKAMENLLRALVRMIRRMRTTLVTLGSRVQELEQIAGVALSPRYRAEKRSYDRMLQYSVTHKGEAAGQIVYSEHDEIMDGTPSLRCSYDADIQVHSEYYCLIYSVEVSAWYGADGLISARASSKVNLGRLDIQLHREGEGYLLEVSRGGQKQVRHIDRSEFDVTELDIYFRLEDQWAPLEAGGAQPLRVLDLSEGGEIFRQILHDCGEDTVTVAGRELPARCIKLEKENRSEDIWYQVDSVVPLAYVRDEGYIYEAGLSYQQGYRELDFLREAGAVGTDEAVGTDRAEPLADGSGTGPAAP